VGDITSIAGLTEATVSNTIADPSVTEPLHAQPIDPPTLSMRFAVNDSPMAGREGTKVTSRMIRDRLEREAESNVAIKVTEADYEASTLRFLQHPDLSLLKIVQGWDPHLARALQDGKEYDDHGRQRCGVTSGPMSFAVFQYQHILAAAERGDWDEVAAAQAAVTALFSAMQDDPAKFADLQRAKYLMGLGQPLTGVVTPKQFGPVLRALPEAPRPARGVHRSEHPGHHAGDRRVPGRTGHHRAAVHRPRHPCAVRAGVGVRAGGAGGQRRCGDDRFGRPVHPDAGGQSRDPGLQPWP